MLREKIQNRICTNWLFLPVCIFIAFVLWWFPQGDYSSAHIWGLGLCLLTTYILTETDTINSLIRIRARSTSSLWLVIISCMGFLHPYHPWTVTATCMAASHFFLFRTYQEHQPVVDIFHSFLLLGLACLYLPQMICLLPFYFWYLIVFLRALTFRGFWAGIIGFLLPGWFVINICFFTNRMALVTGWMNDLTTLQSLCMAGYVAIPPHTRICWAFVIGLSLWCGIYYLLNSYNDKIRTRMLHYILIMQSSLIFLMAALQPHLAEKLLMTMMVCCITCIAHYFTLTRTWTATLVFIVSAIALTAIAVMTLSRNSEITTLLPNIITKLIQ